MHDVAIIGCGPTGATLANLLAMRGLDVLILDRESALYHLPRAVHFDDEVMRVFQEVGIAGDLAERVHINPGMKFVDDQQQLLLDWPRPQDITMHGWHASYRLHQPDLEHLLREQLETHASARFLPDQIVISVEQSDHAVSLTCEHRKTGEVLQHSARYVVGCDGANSFTRRAIGADMEDFGFNERWLVVDVLLKHPRPDLGDHSIQFCNPDRPMTYCRSPGIRRRWEITAKDTESDAELTDPDRVWQFLSRWITLDDADLERAAVYTFESQVATDWRRGRVLIAGDAAHLTPPFMGQGMCTGIRDASNLAWKLAVVARGMAHENLLDSYTAERRPHATAYVEGAIRLGGLINSLDRESALKMASAQSGGSARMRSIAPVLGESSVMNSNTQSGVGRPFAQVQLTDGLSLDEVAKGRHVIATRTPIEYSNRSDLLCLNAQDHPALTPELDALDTQSVWIRPDKYVADVSNTAAELIAKFPQKLGY